MITYLPFIDEVCERNECPHMSCLDLSLNLLPCSELSWYGSMCFGLIVVLGGDD